MKNRQSKIENRKSRAFTLIELLVVVAIIAILAGLILQTAGYVQRKAATSRAEGEIAAISAALESYKADYGDYPQEGGNIPFPSDGESNSSRILIHALGIVRDTNANPLNKVYLELPRSSLSPTTNPTSIIDPFGTAYRYQYPGRTNRSGSNFFDLWSFAGTPTGNTNETNVIRWIKNW